MIIIGFILGVVLSHIAHKIDWNGIMYDIKDRLYEKSSHKP